MEATLDEDNGPAGGGDGGSSGGSCGGGRDNPSETANFLSYIFFWWINPLLYKGFRHKLTPEDFCKVPKESESKRLGDALEGQWNRELAKEAVQTEYLPSLFKSLFKLLGINFLLLGLVVLFQECILRVSQPLLIGRFVRLFSLPSSNDDEESRASQFLEVCLYGGGIVLVSIAYSIIRYPYLFEVMNIGLRARVAMSSLIYRKALRLSNGSMCNDEVNAVVELLSKDVQCLEQTHLVHFLWAAPLQLVIAAYFTWDVVGISALAGVLLVVLWFLPAQGVFCKLVKRLKVKTASIREKRTQIMEDIVVKMDEIRMNTWEYPFARLIEVARKYELSLVHFTNRFHSLNFAFTLTSSRLVILGVLVPLVLTNRNAITPENIFVTIAFFNIVKVSMVECFPRAWTGLADFWAAVQKIQTFLLKEELSDICFGHLDYMPEVPSGSTPYYSITINNLYAKWNDWEVVDTLKDICLSIREKQHFAVVGERGSGKSSLLHALMGEIPLNCGQVYVSGKLSYASQKPWIFPGSIKDNVLFGQDYDEDRYQRVLDACALERELRLLEHGDKTKICEETPNLSRALKSKVNLARAIYNPGDLYLLDDPFSYLGKEDSNHVFQRCLEEMLSDKIVVFTTHKLSLLTDLEHIVQMRDGSVFNQGQYRDIIHPDGSGNFQEISLAKEGREYNEIRTSPSVSILRERKMTNEDSIRDSLGKIIEDRVLQLSGSNPDYYGSDVNMISAVSAGDLAADIDQAGEDYIIESRQGRPFIGTSPDDSDPAEVGWGTMRCYLSKGGGCVPLTCFLVLNVAAEALITGSSIWIEHWTSPDEEEYTNNSSSSVFPRRDGLDILHPVNVNLYVYAVLCIALVAVALAQSCQLYRACLKCSQVLHDDMFVKVLRAFSAFFDRNSVGKILTRFSSDLKKIDERLPTVFLNGISNLFAVCGISVILVLYQPYNGVPLLVSFSILLFLTYYYLRSGLLTRHLAQRTFAPVLCHLSTSLLGLTTLRASRAEQKLIQKFDRLQDINSSYRFVVIATNHWASVVLDWIVSALLAAVIATVIYLNDQEGSEVGVLLTSGVLLSGVLNSLFSLLSELSTLLSSVQRVLDWGKNIEVELSRFARKEIKLNDDWPSKGVVEFRNVGLRYRDREVLRGIEFRTESHENIGVVGNSGAGKTSLATVLLRLVEPSGEILVDKICVQDLGMHQIRGRVSVITEEPVLFPGSLRTNLDPFGRSPDISIWDALSMVRLDETFPFEFGLETELTESKLSVRQRRLLCLARALLKRSKILILDEIYKDIDEETRTLIQGIVRRWFRYSTVLTITKNLRTVMNSDRVLVMADGEMAEFDHPYILLRNPQGALYTLASQNGPAELEELLQLAEDALMETEKPEHEQDPHQQQPQQPLQLQIEDVQVHQVQNDFSTRL